MIVNEMTMKQKNSESGFTLIELLIAIVLTLLLAAGAITIHLSGRQASIDVEQLSRMQENIRFASDYIVRDIRNAGFRDEAFLKWGHEEQIREAYATILNGGSTLRVRYAGRGHCSEAFETFRLVENEYFLDQGNGQLSCRGRSILQTADGATPIDDDSLWGNTIGLVRGVTSLQFETISVQNAPCVFDIKTWEADPSATTLCTGIQITLQLQGMQDVNSPTVFNTRTAQLTAAFRNVIIELINENASASASASG
jgi:prepilin-type N-terminal cleavage/methylation domain-containing protein